VTKFMSDPPPVLSASRRAAVVEVRTGRSPYGFGWRSSGRAAAVLGRGRALREGAESRKMKAYGAAVKETGVANEKVFRPPAPPSLKPRQRCGFAEVAHVGTGGRPVCSAIDRVTFGVLRELAQTS